MTHSQEQTLGPVGVPDPVDETVSPPGMGRVATASFIGTVIEFYDFGIYGTAAALVFPEVFFPALGPAAGITASFAALGVAFVARPFGSLLFGHFGDRLGRKKTLIATMLLMGLSTILVGCMPTADQIGAAAPVLIVVLRVLQGLAAGVSSPERSSSPPNTLPRASVVSGRCSPTSVEAGPSRSPTSRSCSPRSS